MTNVFSNLIVGDINRAQHIYGEATPVLHGKIRRKKQTVYSKIVTFPYLFQYQRDTKPTSIQGHFYVNGLIFIHSRTGKTIYLGKITEIKSNNIVFQSTWGNEKKLWHKMFQYNGLPRRKQVQHQIISVN